MGSDDQGGILFYFLEETDNDAIGLAHSSEVYQFDMISEGSTYEEWEPVPFHLREGCLVDYQPNDLIWPLCSATLKSVIDLSASPSDCIQWLDATVVDSDGKEHEYYILHLPYRFDVLDNEQTIWQNGYPDTPVLDFRKVGDHKVFSFPGAELTVFVTGTVRAAIERAKCTGVDFWLVSVDHLIA